MPGLTVKYLRCEYKVNPAGIDSKKPRFSWITETGSCPSANLKQTAYQLLVSSSEYNVINNIADIWDSGRVNSHQSIQIEYNGKELMPVKKYWWKVKVWADIIESGWSESAYFITGIYKKNDWIAKWIGYDEYENKHYVNNKYNFYPGDKWIWLSPHIYSTLKNIPKVLFRHNFEIKSITDIENAFLLVTADEGFKFHLNNILTAESDGKIFSWTRPVFVNITSMLHNGKNNIHAECINSYLDKPGFTAKIFIVFKDGTEKVIKTNEDWEVTKEGLQWERAGIIAEMGDMPWRIPHYKLFLPPPSYLRKEFRTNKKIKNVYLFIAALGMVKAFLNGKCISNDQFIPGWSDYNKRVYYKMYDVKEFLSDNNCIGLILADGWYAGYIGWEKHRGYYGDFSRCLLQAIIEYEDGSNETIVSDETWKAAYGPIREADLLMGETYDASFEEANNGWSFPGYDDTAWDHVAVEEKFVELNSYPGEPVKQTMDLKSVNVASSQNNIHLFDLGQNIAGCARLKIDGRLTSEVTLRFGEVLTENGELYTDNLRMARATDTYKTKGIADETWQPEFTYHGFRYVDLKGYPGKPGKDTITGIVLHSDIPVTGSFRCSNEKVNRLFENILWSQRANYFDIPTDCPQRDERLGWTADAIDFFKTAAYNMDISAFYTKWLQDLNDAQQQDGAYTAIAPPPLLGVGPLYAGAAGWADAGIITPYYLYRFYDDKRILKKYFPNMLRYMEYLERNSKDYIRPDEGYGDWLSINADTPKDLISTAFYAFNANNMKEVSGLLNNPGYEQKFSSLFNNIKAAFNEHYILPDHTIKSGTQTACALALSFDLLNKYDENKTIEELVKNIKDRDYHISSGFIGLQFIMPLLSKYGYTDVAYKVLMNESYPSWLNMINNGATTMWERWDSYLPDKGIYDPLMNSFNHTSFGVVGEWLYSVVGGISPLKPGFNKIKIQPEPGGGLTFAETTYISVYGKIITSWRYENNTFTLKVTIPFNTTAEVFLLKKYGLLIKTEPECIYAEQKDQYILNVGSGEYLFLMRL